MNIFGAEVDVLSVDFNKQHDMICVSSAVDKTCKLWDLRAIGNVTMQSPVTCFYGHEYAVRKVRFSPHFDNLFASVSYDMSVILWDTKATDKQLAKRYQHHTEFIIGLDWNLFEKGQLATASWDKSIKIYNILN